MVSRFLCLTGVAAVFLALYAAKVWLLYFLADVVGIQTLPHHANGDGEEELHSMADSTADLLPDANVSAAYLAAATAFRKGDYEQALQEAAGCEANDAACLGLQGEFSLVGAAGPRNLSEALRLFNAAADLGDPNS